MACSTQVFRQSQGSISARILVCHGDADPMVPRSQVHRFLGGNG